MDESMRPFFSGEQLYGDNFTPALLAKWYEEEAEGYSGLVQTHSEYRYVYHALNKTYGFSKVQLAKDSVALGVGSSECEELRPILPFLQRIVSLEPSGYFTSSTLDAVPISRVRPSPDGAMPFADATFDIITCFGVLHHVANVTFVLSECFRVLKPGGVMFLREPIVSMGDWRKPRRGLTKNERGIPFEILKETVTRQGFRIQSLTLHDFSPLVRTLASLRMGAFENKWSALFDHFLSQAFAFNYKYHRESVFDRFAPASAFLVLRRD
jgi:SAM-dependent methyltransferase